ncbi:MAG: DUF362 domain-containing protein, partial [Eubacteriales bacterium]|nr:DUF362 domain-containing protein [Eubacteriales bacterium]
MTTVSVRRVPDYNDEALYRAVCSHFEVLQVDRDLTPETRVLLKPNLLSGRDPALAVTTHPALLRAISRRLRELGVKRIVLADSPGGVYTAYALRKAYAASRFNTLSDVLTLNENTDSSAMNGFNIIQPVLDADFIINCPKLKTHGLTTLSAGVKNLFGCIPGLQKPEWHYLRPSVETFSEMLIDLAETVKPSL